MRIKIISAPDKLTWYARIIGNTIEAEYREWTGLPGVWAREEKEWRLYNYIPQEDYEIIE